MITQYTTYFKNLAVELLEHQEAEGEETFFAIDFAELLSKFRNGIRPKGEALYAIRYQSRFQGPQLEIPEGGFVVMAWYESSPKEVYAATELLVYQVMARMQRDCNDNNPALDWASHDSFEHLDGFEKVPYQYAADPNYAVWLVTFNWKNRLCLSDFLETS